jgi:hypothetical protein
MALDLFIRVVDTETGTPTDLFTAHNLTPEQLGYLHMLEDIIMFGGEIIKFDLDNVSG